MIHVYRWIAVHCLHVDGMVMHGLGGEEPERRFSFELSDVLHWAVISPGLATGWHLDTGIWE